MKGSRNRAFRILIACMLAQGGAIGLAYNSMGILMVAICADEGFSISAFSLFTSIRTLSAALAMPLLSRLVYHRHPERLRYILAGLSVVMFGAMAAATTFDSIEPWYAVGALMGVSSSLFSVNQAYIIANWFKKRTNLFIGLSGASSGIAGAAFSPLVSLLIQAAGWRVAQLSVCTLGLLAVFGGSIQMYLTPQEIGLKPYGYQEIPEFTGMADASSRSQDVVQYAQWAGYALMGMLLFVSTSNSSLASSLTHLPNYANELGYSLTQAALFSSFAMVGNMLGKVTMGWLCDRFDYRKVTGAAFALISLAAYLIAVLGDRLPLALACALVLGTSQSVMNVLMHMLVRNLMGQARYISVFSTITSISSLVAAPVYALVGYSFDATGSYFTVLMICCALYALSLLMLLGIFHIRAHANVVQQCPKVTHPKSA